MGLVLLQILCLVVKFSAIASSFVFQGSAGFNLSPSPATSFAGSPIGEGTPEHAIIIGKPITSYAPIPTSKPNVSILQPPLVPPPLNVAPTPHMIKSFAPSISPRISAVLPPLSFAPPPSFPPEAPERKLSPHNGDPGMLAEPPVSVAPPPERSKQNPPPIHPVVPASSPPWSHQYETPDNAAPPSPSVHPVAPAPRKTPQNTPATPPSMPKVAPSIFRGPFASPPINFPPNSPTINPTLPAQPPSNSPEPRFSPISTPPPSIHGKRGSVPLHKTPRDTNDAPPPLAFPPSPPVMRFHSPRPLPSTSLNRHHHARKNITSPVSLPYLVPPPTEQGQFIPQAPLHPPKSDPKSNRKHYAHPPLIPGGFISPAPLHPPKPDSNSNRKHYAPSPLIPGSSISPLHSHFHSPENHFGPVPSPSPSSPSIETIMPFLSPKISPSRSSPRNPKTPLLPPIHTLPPPPPNKDCASISCVDPLTNTPPGSPCGCVLPMKVGLRLSVALYTFFPLVSELASEIAAGVFLDQSQVRIMGANAASQDPEKTIVLIDLVPLGDAFDKTSALLTFQRFWHKQVFINSLFFGDYEVLYVHYPGLPPSPPSATIAIIDGVPYPGRENNSTIQPLGVDVSGRQRKERLNGSVIVIIALLASLAVILCCAFAWFMLFKRKDRFSQPDPTLPTTLSSLAKSSGIAASIMGSGPSSTSLSFESSIAYTGSAKTFNISDIEKATDNFSALRILGEGGFGRVYSGFLEDSTKVAVKVLKRDDQQGGREFLAEVEMLSRLHHRNLVKLIGICTEDRARCLVYELIPNGSVESHLHGADKETAPLDWSSRLKIALGAARALAYLHEDSSPRVIHRDFKSSNILLEHDFTPKVSDFGLARSALDEENGHISTRVMGTFGYVAPEYAMTGHLLVKSDVYSYGVVLLELLTGRKPVDMSRPPGQENLVAWARPLLTTAETLESIIDPSLGPVFPFDGIAKVSAIASMCVQPEVSHRPFMGEVVQALKLVCNECDETKESDFSGEMAARIGTNSGQLDPLRTHSPALNYDSGLDIESGFSASELYGRSSSSGLLRARRGRRLWQRLRRLSGSSVSENGIAFRLRPGSH